MSQSRNIPYDIVISGSGTGINVGNYGYHLALQRGGSSYASIEEFLNAIVDSDEQAFMQSLKVNLQAFVTDEVLGTAGNYIVAFPPIIEIWEVKATQAPGAMSVSSFTETDAVFAVAATEVPKQFKRLGILKLVASNVANAAVTPSSNGQDIIHTYQGEFTLKGIRSNINFFYSDEAYSSPDNRTFLLYVIRWPSTPAAANYMIAGTGVLFADIENIRSALK
jgi:hypothetical protein